MKARIWISTLIIAILVWGVNSVSYSQEKTKEKAKTEVKTEKPIEKKSEVQTNQKKDNLSSITNVDKKNEPIKRDKKMHHKMNTSGTGKTKETKTNKNKETSTDKEKIK
jgi:hypothetical protein